MCGNILSVGFFFLAFCPVNILSVGVQILEPNRFFLTNILSSSPALYINSSSPIYSPISLLFAKGPSTQCLHRHHGGCIADVSKPPTSPPKRMACAPPRRHGKFSRRFGGFLVPKNRFQKVKQVQCQNLEAKSYQVKISRDERKTM